MIGAFLPLLIGIFLTYKGLFSKSRANAFVVGRIANGFLFCSCTAPQPFASACSSFLAMLSEIAREDVL